MKEKLLILLFFSISLVSCKKTVYEDNPPQLEITVLDSNLEKVSNAEVILYESESDLAEDKNEKSRTSSNSGGIALFENLETKIYYINVLKNDYNHKEAITHLKNALNLNEKIKLTITINN